MKACGQVDLLRFTLPDFESAQAPSPFHLWFPRNVLVKWYQRLLLGRWSVGLSTQQGVWADHNSAFCLNLACRETTMNVFECILRNVYNSGVLFEADWLFLEAFALLWKATISFVLFVCLSLRPHGTTRLPRDGFSWIWYYLFFESMLRKLKFEVYLKTYIHLWQYLAEFFLEW